MRRIIPVIVTTAELIASDFDPKDIDLQAGEIESAQFGSVPHLRFRKSLRHSEPPVEYDAATLGDLSAGSERTVFVVRGSQLIPWLEGFQTHTPEGNSPWENARRIADAMGG